MSHDAWGGGSDDDPKLRLKELARLKELREKRPENGVPDGWTTRLGRAMDYDRQHQTGSYAGRPRPRFSVFDALLLLIAAIGVMVALAVTR